MSVFNLKLVWFPLLCTALCAVPVWAVESNEVVVANIATRGFDVFLRTFEPPADSQLEIFCDAEGTVPATDLTFERQPLLTGLTLGDDYERRCADRQMRLAMTAAGNSLFRVANAEPDTSYFICLSSDQVTWPASGLYEVQTLPLGNWRETTHQQVVDVNRPGDGWVGTITAAGAYAPLLAVCGDGTPTNSSFFFNLADLVDPSGLPFTPAEGAPLDFRLYGSSGSKMTQRTILYTSPAANDASVAALSTEDAPLLRLVIASAVAAVCDPSAGEHFYFSGEDITCRIAEIVVTQGDSQFVGYGWTGSGDIPLNGRTTTFSFSLQSDSQIAWRWRTNLWVEVLADHGVVDLASGWYRSGSEVTASVAPDAEWLFREWSGLTSGIDSHSTFTVANPGQLVATFDPVLVPDSGGMPEWWLTLAGLAGADRALEADPDNDGMSNLREWQADTSPTNTLSDLRITALTRENSGVNLTWRGGREAKQIVEMLEGDLKTGNWHPISTNLPPTATVGSCTVELEGKPAVFFRIKAER
ncbi:MAG: hypothetical protein PF904_16605 [Kiritimatiellae bacterium]|jgi:hypothetical protein|nr:hypothetical protein [Kiritimatiellia bacterium]